MQGQICIAPDYMMMPKGKVDEFIDESTKAVSEMYPRYEIQRTLHFNC